MMAVCSRSATRRSTRSLRTRSRACLHADDFLEQLHRILGRDGGLLFTVPFVWDEHEQPIDYGRHTSLGVRSLLERHGFEVVELRKSAADARVIFQLMNCYIYKRIRDWPAVFRLPVWMLITPLTNIAGALLGALLPTNEDLYLENGVFARKVTTSKKTSDV